MRILALYISREFLKLFVLFLASFVALYTIFDLIEKVDNFQEAGVPVSTMMGFFILQIPELVSLLLPMSILMATILTLGLMARRNEIVAIKSAGVSLFRLTLPIILIALTLAVGQTLFNETVIPGTKTRTNFIWDVLVEKRPPRLTNQEKFWFKGKSAIYSIGFYEPGTRTMSDVIYYRFDKNFNLIMRVDAKRLKFIGGKWTFLNGLYQEMVPGGGYQGHNFDELILKLPETLEDFSRLTKPSEEMSLPELASFLRKLESEGYDSVRYKVDLQAKLSFPFVCLIMALWGIPLALFKERGQALAPGVVLGLGVALTYWVGFSYARSIFGYSGVLPPLVAVWLPNGIFGLCGLWFLTHIRQ